MDKPQTLFFCALFAAALLTLAAAAEAANPAEIAKTTATLFLNETEVPSLVLVPFQSGGENYYLVKTFAGEQLLLHEKNPQSGTAFEAVEGAGAIESLIMDYRKDAAAQFDNETLEQIKNEIKTLNDTYQYCAKPMTGFLNTGTLLYQILYLADMGSPNRTPYTANAVNRIRGNQTTLKNGTTIKFGRGSAEILAAGFKSASDAAEVLENAQTDLPLLAEKLNSLYAQIAEMKAVAGNYSTDFAFLKSRYPEMLNKRDCKLSSQSFNALEEILESQGAVLGSPSLAQKIAQSTAARKPSYEAKKSLLEFSRQYGELAAREKRIEAALAPANVTPSSLSRKLLQLQRTMEDLQSAENLSDARRKQEAFKKLYEKALSEAENLSDNETLAKIAESAEAVNAAKTIIEGAEAGGADKASLSEYKYKLQAIQTELDDALFWVEFGGGQRANPQAFWNITVKAREFQEQAKSLQTGSLQGLRPENYALAAAAIATIAGIAYYQFGRKKHQGL
ncbi:MAG: hypothetical protein WC792_06495 [Candidatus Micrarchaeia archaeon]|jgi:hypothetical protein